jgi:integrase
MIEFYVLLPPPAYIHVSMSHVNLILRDLSRTIPQASSTYQHIIDCLEEVAETANTYNALRGDINTLLNFSWFVLGKDITELSRKDFQRFIDFCNAPPEHLIGKYSSTIIDAKLSTVDYVEINKNWTPFVNRNMPEPYKRTLASLKAQLSNLSYMFTYFEDIEYSHRNPAAIALRRMTSAVKRNLKVDRSEIEIKSLNSVQLQFAFNTVERLAKENPEKHERTRFLFHFLIYCYPRVSETSARPGFSPLMSDFRLNRPQSGSNEGGYCTFFIPNSKGGKSREVIVSPDLLKALTRYRRYLKLSDFPQPSEKVPLFVRHRAATHGRQASIVDANLSAGRLASIIKDLFADTAKALEAGGYTQDADEIRNLTCHACRHTGITIDILSGRPRHEIMQCAGHSSEATLARYQSKRSEFRAASASLKDNYLIKRREALDVSDSRMENND